MADHLPHVPLFPLPTDEQAIALRIAADYLSLVGRQTATALFGCPSVDDDTKLLASISNSMLTGAALCEGLVELIEQVAER